MVERWLLEPMPMIMQGNVRGTLRSSTIVPKGYNVRQELSDSSAIDTVVEMNVNPDSTVRADCDHSEQDVDEPRHFCLICGREWYILPLLYEVILCAKDVVGTVLRS